MIFVSLGTHEQPFARALTTLSELDCDDQLLVQHGATPVLDDLPKARWVAYLEWRALTGAMHDADVVITHAGVGSAVTAVRAGKKPILVPRLAQFGEHVDDHQLQLADRFSARDVALVCTPDDDLNALVRKARNSEPAATFESARRLRRAVVDAALAA